MWCQGCLARKWLFKYNPRLNRLPTLVNLQYNRWCEIQYFKVIYLVRLSLLGRVILLPTILPNGLWVITVREPSQSHPFRISFGQTVGMGGFPSFMSLSLFCQYQYFYSSHTHKIKKRSSNWIHNLSPLSQFQSIQVQNPFGHFTILGLLLCKLLLTGVAHLLTCIWCSTFSLFSLAHLLLH